MKAILWHSFVLYLGLAVVYATYAHRHGQMVRAPLAKLALSLPFTLVTARLGQIFFASLSPHLWTHARYLPLLVALAATVLWLRLLLAAETKALVRAIRSSPALAPLPALTVLMLASMLCVSIVDLGFEWLGRTSDAPWKSIPISRGAWRTNVLIVFSGYALVFALTARVAAALLLVSPPYLALGIASLAKLEYMHTAVQPLDVLRVPEFLPLFRSFFGTATAIATAVVAGTWLLGLALVHRAEPTAMPAPRRRTIGLVAFLVLLFFPAAFFAAQSFPPARTALTLLAAPEDQWKDASKRNGMLLSFLSELPSMAVMTPADYSAAVVRESLARYWQPPASSGETLSRARPAGGVNLVLYILESFMDPDDLGMPLSGDPIPNFRALRDTGTGGYGIVAEDFGGSANTEFEALTGMAQLLLPDGSLAYRQYLKRPVPSLPRLLGSLGYATVVVQPGDRSYFDRERAYGMLGFDRAVWLGEVPNVERGPRVGWPSDRTVVDTIIELSRGRHPFFAFAFPASPHSPYNSGVFRDSGLSVRSPNPGDTMSQVKEYVNALLVADRAIGRLVEHFRTQPDSTIIAIVGDHLPPLSDQSLRAFRASLAPLSRAERELRLRRVPLAVWANFPLPKERLMFSLNALPSYLLARMGIPAPGLLALTDTIRRRLPVLGRRYAFAADGRAWDRDSLPPELQRVIDDYHVLQYDLLLGEQYSLPAGLRP